MCDCRQESHGYVRFVVLRSTGSSKSLPPPDSFYSAHPVISSLSHYFVNMFFSFFLLEFWRLTELMKKVSHEVVNGGGIVRGIHNHGIRTVPHRFKAAYADQLGRRYYEKVRFVSVYFDCNPATRLATEQVVRLDEHVLRQTHLRARCPFEKMNELKSKKNPWLKIIHEQEEAIHGTPKTTKELEEEEMVSFFE